MTPPVPDKTDAAPLRIIILTYESVFANSIIHALVDCAAVNTVAIVYGTGILPGKSWLAGLRHAVGQSGPVFIARKAAEVGFARAVASTARLAGRKLAIPSLQDLADIHAAPLIPCADARRPGFGDKLAQHDADLLVSVNFNQRIPKDWLCTTRMGAVNLHGALLPRNRGLFPYFWALANGDTEHGATLHWVDEELDTGDVIARRTFPIRPDDTMLSLEAGASILGAQLLCDGLKALAEGSASAERQDHSAATYNSWPTRAALRAYESRGRSYGSVLRTLSWMQRETASMRTVKG